MEIKQEAAKKFTHDDCLSKIKLLLMKCLSKQVKKQIFGAISEKKRWKLLIWICRQNNLIKKKEQSRVYNKEGPEKKQKSVSSMSL